MGVRVKVRVKVRVRVRELGLGVRGGWGQIGGRGGER